MTNRDLRCELLTLYLHRPPQNTDHADCEDSADQVLFSYSCFAFTFNLHFFWFCHKLLFNYISECLLFITIYAQATQAW